MCLSQSKWRVRQLLAALYPAHLEESPAEDPEEVVSIDVLASDMEGGAVWYLAS